MAKVIGIDLGTTNSCVAVMEGGEVNVIPNEEGMRTTPSVVAFKKNGERIVGLSAKRQAVVNPENTIMSIKRKMGNAEKVKADGKEFTPQEISAMVLQKMKQIAEGHLGEKVTQAVITVPAYFLDAQKQATKDAGKIAGLEVLRIINEPTAAALAYGYDKLGDQEKKILVYDLGGGTFDVSILEVAKGFFEVKATKGSNHLGGDDFDELIMNWIVEEFKKDQGIDLSNDIKAMQRLKDAAEKAKIDLSGMMETNISVPYITLDESGPKHLEMNLSRAKFEQMIAALIGNTMKLVKDCLRDAGCSITDIDDILLVGGSTRVPLVQKEIREHFNKEPNKGINPDECVAMGAAVQAAVLAGDVKDVLLIDVAPLSLGIETLGGVFTKIIERNTTIPCKKSQIFSTADDNQPAVSIHVLQGEREMAGYNKTLGRFDLVGIPPAPRGVPQIEVTFNIDANGIVHVSAKDLGTGKEQQIKIEMSGALSEAEIDKMVKDAELYGDEDKKRKEEIELKNTAENTVYHTEKLLKEHAEKIDAPTKENIEKAIEGVKKALKENDTDKIKSAMETLNQTAHKLSEAMYSEAMKNQQAAGGESGEANAESSDDNVIDAEVEPA